ncbi:MAG TPA: SMC-Scp complex subunit ScpB [Candidatus Saccharimonadales bacterium]|nr:SMC-Scp complex subunit ScpB [Candidatus Saccharimonadales bacterium]
MTNEERKAALEAIIYAADEPATIEQLAAALGEDKIVVQASIDELVAGYAVEERGIEIRAVAGGYKLYTKPQQHDVVRKFIKSLRTPLRLTMPALETLAVISYKQPVTAPEISEIRGVNTSGVINTLLDKKLITTAGRKEVMGRPILYKTSKEFLLRFGLSDLGELPSLKEFEALAREALGADEGIAQAEDAPGEATPGMSEEQAAAELLAKSEALERAAERAEALHESVSASARELVVGEPGERDMGMPPGEAGEAATSVAEVLAEAEQAEEQELLAEEVNATNEGMPAGDVDESPKTEAAAAGE